MRQELDAEVVFQVVSQPLGEQPEVMLFVAEQTDVRPGEGNIFAEGPADLKLSRRASIPEESPVGKEYVEESKPAHTELLSVVATGV